MSAIYGRIEHFTPSGSSLDDCYIATKKLFKAKKKKSCKCEVEWPLRFHASKWANSGSVIFVATGNFNSLTPPKHQDFEV